MEQTGIVAKYLLKESFNKPSSGYYDYGRILLSLGSMGLDTYFGSLQGYVHAKAYETSRLAYNLLAQTIGQNICHIRYKVRYKEYKICSTFRNKII